MPYHSTTSAEQQESEFSYGVVIDKTGLRSKTIWSERTSTAKLAFDEATANALRPELGEAFPPSNRLLRGVTSQNSDTNSVPCITPTAEDSLEESISPAISRTLTREDVQTKLDAISKDLFERKDWSEKLPRLGKADVIALEALGDGKTYFQVIARMLPAKKPARYYYSSKSRGVESGVQFHVIP